MTALPPSGIGAFLGLAALITFILIGAAIHDRLDRRHTRNREITRLRRVAAQRAAEQEREWVL
jgi:pyridoxine 5'-phosphate synthase PdxJ